MTNKEKELLKGGLKTALENLFKELKRVTLGYLEELEEELDDFVEELIEYSESTEGDNDGESEGGKDDYE